MPLVAILAVWGGLIIGAVYMLRAIRQLLHGPVLGDAPELVDARGPWRKLPFLLLLAALLVFGCFPRLLTDKIKPSAVRNQPSRVVAAPGDVPRSDLVRSDVPRSASRGAEE